MTQIRTHNYNRPLVSFDENRRLLGMLEPGRYRGFDTPKWGTNTITIAHAITGVVETRLNQSLTFPQGVTLSRQGVTIKEDDVIGPLPILSNVANAFRRVDTFVVEHEITNSPGGQEAIYSIIQGPDGDENPAPLTAPQKQIVLGYITMQPSTATTAGAIYTYAKVFHTGGLLAAILNEVNQFQNLNQFKTVAGLRVVLNDGAQDWTGFTEAQGNTIRNLPQPGIANEVSFLPRVQGSTFLMIQNFTTFNMPIRHSVNDGLGGEPLHPSIWGKYAAIDTQETTVSIPPQGWALFWCNIGTDITTTNPYWSLVITSGQNAAIGSLNGSIAALNASINTKANKVQEAWRVVGEAGNPAFQNNFISSVPMPLRFKRDDMGNCYLQGAVLWDALNADGRIFTLPAGYRPTQFVILPGRGDAQTYRIAIEDSTGHVILNVASLAQIELHPFYLNFSFRLD